MISIILLVILSTLSGCQESETKAVTFKNVELESSIVKLVNASLQFEKDKFDQTISVKLYYLLQNIADRDLVDIQIYIDFYDEENNLVASVGPKTNNLPSGYRETVHHPQINIITYNGEDVNLIDHAIIRVSEM
jgi:hypothetical protein